MKEMKSSEAYIITYDEESTITVQEGTIHVVRAWEWMLLL
jgi:predicted AAA+ superfamily ATPase